VTRGSDGKKWSGGVLDKTGARVVFSLRVISARLAAKRDITDEAAAIARVRSRGRESCSWLAIIVNKSDQGCYAWACLDVWRAAGTDMGGSGY
jgi:hypothetical protein